ncbi:exo-beta-1,3-glucanase (GH17 family) [Allocatelliglobosispora scoriae]|uniref:Exo-beta-1,3-glucanase (GH17 family) n=1 Tax=Allocatelliglobosispora scoriae TaxID=643052 RepID=A0A841BKF8_9ACTN|nr:hypothetical protein [Allocatelliglobosispora scoriae]MBB5867716.1 exo-beta-1,3-glucanase (GH17 family) [Allocatelliglobosispora scoriae]
MRPEDRSSQTRFQEYFLDTGSRMVVYVATSDSRGPIADDLLLAQLRRLREKFDGLVLYDTSRASARVVQAAVTLGYSAVLLTIHRPRSRLEIHRAARLIRRHGEELTMAVAIGSEGLLQHRYAESDVVAARRLLRRLLGRIEIETTSTEPWWRYLESPEHPAFTAIGDFVSPMVHAIWDTDLTDPARMVAWTARVAAATAKKLDRPVLIREAGIPGQGTHPRLLTTGPFTRENQAAFWRAWMTFTSHRPLPPVIVHEGIDNDGKTWDDFEGHWGLLANNHNCRAWPAWDAFPALPPRQRHRPR